MAYSVEMKKQLAQARKEGKETLGRIETDLGEIRHVESGVVIDLFLSYWAVKAWERMILLAGKMPAPLEAAVMVQEQPGLALNRAGRREEAEQVLLELIERRGPSSET